MDPDVGWDLINRVVCRWVGDGDRHTPTWTDLVGPAAGINPPGQASDPTLDNTIADWPGTLLFAGNAENILAGSWQVIHEWEEGTVLRPHIHWMLTSNSAAAVTWEFHYRISAIGSVAGAWSAAVPGVLTVDHGNVADAHAISAFGEIDMTGNTLSVIVWWRLHRQGVTDANNDDARLLSIDAHYRKDGTGSKQEFVKG
jgi:hypothetical protein